ncbi:MAG: 5-formyltetrahydrofolate cyclo-ligase [Beijerinckiaceae bacterium]
MSSPPPKVLFRKQALERRAAVADSVRTTFAEKLAVEGVELCRRAFVQNVALYWPIGSEPDTKLLLMALAHHELTPCLPVTIGPRGTPLLFRKYIYGQPMQQGPMETYEPAHGLPEATPDFTFVPLAAFDRRGFRIGYGGGHYDATLARLRATRPGPAVGIAFSCQEIEAVPEESHDQPLDFVLTENELIDCSLAWR